MDAFTAHGRFWEEPKLNRPSPSFMLSLVDRARSTRPESRIGRVLMVSSLFATAVMRAILPADGEFQ